MLIPVCHPWMAGLFDTLKALLIVESIKVKHTLSIFLMEWKKCLRCANVVSIVACSVLVNGAGSSNGSAGSSAD